MKANATINTKPCENCKKDILLSNYMTHINHCLRHFYLCDRCNQPVRKNNSNFHEITNHGTVECDNCHLKLEKCCLTDHQDNECLHRKVKCKICDIDVKAMDVMEHEDYCGSRTEKCVNCNEFVMLKYKMVHIESNHKFFKMSDEPGPSPSKQNMKLKLGDFLPDLSSNNTTLNSNEVKRTKKKSRKKFKNLQRMQSSEGEK